MNNNPCHTGQRSDTRHMDAWKCNKTKKPEDIYFLKRGKSRRKSKIRKRNWKGPIILLGWRRVRKERIKKEKKVQGIPKDGSAAKMIGKESNTRGKEGKKEFCCQKSY